MAGSQQPTRIHLLAQKLQQGTITPDEQKEFDEWYTTTGNIFEVDTDETFDQMETRLYKDIVSKAAIRENEIRQLWLRIAAVASVLFIIYVGIYYLTPTQPVQNITQQYVISPGTNKAVLTLANGSTINLTDVKSGVIANENGVSIKKSNDGEISYSSGASGKSNAIKAYNTIATPRGGQWPVVVLPDGTKVVLDASSSITYPVRFTGGERRVEITGQVYFDVVHNAMQPFKVIAGDQVIEDIGTQFNVNSYNDEPLVSTTLLEGAVKITVANNSTLLKPGQRAIINKKNKAVSIADVNLKETVDWKNGQISFENKSIQEIMRQVSRWYDVDIEYSGNLHDRKFTGGISRMASLAELLKILEFNGIHCSVNGKKITITFNT